MNWYIGQEIVCVKTHSSRMVIMGKTYKITGLRSSTCKCNWVEISVGINYKTANNMDCSRCGVVDNILTFEHWFGETLFAPLDQDISELTEILEQPIKQVQEL